MPLPLHVRDPFTVVQTGGAYDVGRTGWSATDLAPVIDGQPGYVVIGTALTSEDTGELLFAREGDKLRFIPEDESMGVHITDHKFVVTFHPERQQVQIVDRVSFHCETNARQFVFRMSPQYVVDRVADDNGEPVTFSESQGVVLIRRVPKEEFHYTIRYSAIVDQPGFAGSIRDQEATLTNDYWYPMIARYPAPYEAEIHAPLGWTPLAQGEKIAQEDRPTETVARFKMDLPVTYYSLSAAPYKTFSQVIGGRRFSVWSLRMSEEQMREQTEFYAPILKFYEQFAPYPFSGYGAVDSAVYGGGALEAYSFATYGGGLPEEDAHEPSHTWWGGILDNTYLSSFWNESFAVFCEGLYARNVPIGNDSERRWAFVRPAGGTDDFDQVPILDAGVSAGKVASSLGYGKGSQVLQMLEQLVGTQRMIRIMHDWIAVHEKGTPADWPEFEEVAEKDAPELKLASFFRDWLARPGYAHLGAQVSYAGGATQIDLEWKGPRFRMPLLVLLRLRTGEDVYKLLDTANGDRFRLSGPKPALVSIDPFRQALRDEAANEEPLSLNSFQNSEVLADAAHTDWNLASTGTAAPMQAPGDLGGTLVIGSPESLPWMKPLCDKVGFSVSGDTLTYKGTSIDLRHGCAMAVVDLGGGRRCKISLGKTRHSPEFGGARLGLSDDLGRFLRGDTSPKTSGNLTYRLGG